jgi:hypothetical protein
MQLTSDTGRTLCPASTSRTGSKATLSLISTPLAQQHVLLRPMIPAEIAVSMFPQFAAFLESACY